MNKIANFISRRIRSTIRIVHEERRNCDTTDRLVRLRMEGMPASRALRIAFVLEFPEAWQSYESVWRAFSSCANCETEIIAVAKSHVLSDTGHSTIDFCVAKHLPFRVAEQYDLHEHMPDVMFFHRPFEAPRPANLTMHVVSKIVPRIAYIPYGFEISGGEASRHTHFSLPLHLRAWRIFVRSQRFKDMYGRYCSVGNAHVVVAGYPMVDAVLKTADTTVDARLRQVAVGRKVLLWNPQWNETKERNGISTFMRWKDLMIAIFRANRRIALIFRPHPLLFATLIRNGLMTADETHKFCEEMSCEPNIYVDTTTDFCPSFSISDGLLSDVSSFLLLYAATGKPVLYLPNPDGPGLNEDGELINLHYYIGNSEESIRKYIEMVADGKDPMKEGRMAQYPEYIHMPANGSGMYIKDYVMNAVKMGV